MSQAERTEARYQDQWARLAIPHRRRVARGVTHGLTYTVSQKVSGMPLDSLGLDGLRQNLPAVLEQLVGLARVDVSGTVGYGWLDPDCQGTSTSWAEHLLSVADEHPGNFYDHWHQLFDTSFLERARFERVLAQLNGLVHDLPDLCYLVHGDFGYGNVFVEEGRVTALLDWQNGRYGDPAFDLAGMMFWRDAPLAGEIYRLYLPRAQRAGIPLDRLRERVQGYSLYLGLDALRFSARTNNPGIYASVCTRLERLEGNAQEW